MCGWYTSDKVRVGAMFFCSSWILKDGIQIIHILQKWTQLCHLVWCHCFPYQQICATAKACFIHRPRSVFYLPLLFPFIAEDNFCLWFYLFNKKTYLNCSSEGISQTPQTRWWACQCTSPLCWFLAVRYVDWFTQVGLRLDWLNVTEEG